MRIGFSRLGLYILVYLEILIAGYVGIALIAVSLNTRLGRSMKRPAVRRYISWRIWNPPLQLWYHSEFW